MLHYLKRKSKQRLGFTLVETMIVITIIAVLALVARTAVMTIRKNMDYTEANNNAKTIYMASQANLTEMRSMGKLPELIAESEDDSPSTLGVKYRISRNKPGNASESYDLIVPASVDATIRNQQVLVVYHPSAGIVHSVFYYEGKSDLFELYVDLNFADEEKLAADLKANCIGYYTVENVDALTENEFKVVQTAASIRFGNKVEYDGVTKVENTKEVMITVEIPVVDKSGTNIFTDLNYDHYISGLEVTLTVTGQNGGQFTKTVKSDDQGVVFEKDNVGNNVLVQFPVDSLTSSFTAFAPGIAAGDNISVTADVTYYPQSTDPIILIDSATIAGINPMFHALTDNPEYATDNTKKPYILSVANGRHLQNLGYLDAELAKKIESIVFTKENGEGGELALTWYDDAQYKPLNLTDVPAIVGNGVKIKNLVINAGTDGNVGLFGKLTNTSVAGITLVDPSIATTGTTATGALIGTAANAVVTDCHVISADNTISGEASVGGLVGIASNNSKLENCTSEATVLGSGNAASNVGGLVGTLQDASIDSCVVEKARVQSGSASGTGNALGGLVGAVKNAFRDSAKAIEKCEVKSTVHVIGTAGSTGDLGGMVGNAKSAHIGSSKCFAYVTVEAYGTAIPQNNLGGFVGKSEGSKYAANDVTLDYKPQRAENAGGFAGVMSGDEVVNLDIFFPLNNVVSERTVTNFGGIASRCENKTKLETVKLISEVTFNNAKSNVAGAFCYFGDGCEIANSAINIAGIKKYDNLTMAGFAVENKGTIQNCFSYVEMDGGYAFVKINTGNVVYCVGWALGDKESTLTLDKCKNSYFVDGVDKVVLYNNTAVVDSIKNTDDLSGNDALEALNKGNDGAWIKDGAKHPYPVLATLKAWTQKEDPYNRFYGFFESLKFFGPVISNQPYALRYVETYSDGTTGELIVHYTASGAASIKADTLKDGAIGSTAFYLCHRDGTLGYEASTVALDSFQLAEANERYTVYKLTNNTNYQDTLKLNTYYPLYTANSYRIRTAEQFKNIAQNPGATFRLANNIVVDNTVNGTFTGNLHGAGLAIEAKAPLFAGIGENAVISNCKITTTLPNPFGNFNGAQEMNATHWATDNNLTAYVDGFDSKFTAVSGTVISIPASVEGTTVNGKPVLRYFYNVSTIEKEQLATNDVTLTSVEVTEELLVELEADKSGYYVKVEGNGYDPLVNTPAVGDTIYKVNGSIPTGITGSCYIKIGEQYLAADKSLAAESSVWTANGNGTYTNGETTVDGNDIFKMFGQLTIQKITKYYESTPLGLGMEIANS